MQFTRQVQLEARITMTSFPVALQIGQIMLSMPNAYAKMGLAAGLCLSLFSGCVSAYTIMLLVHLYEERKKRLVRRLSCAPHVTHALHLARL